jgi:hypothetical protein
MVEYSIDIRLAGHAREYVRRLLYSAARRFRTGETSKDIQIPSICIYGPFKTDYPEKVLNVVGQVAGRYELVPYRVKGFQMFEVERKWLIFNHGMRGVYLDVEPSDKLVELRKELAERLDTICGGTSIDKDLRNLHAGVELSGIDGNFDRIFSYLKENEETDIIQRLVRITVTRNHEVFCEYDMASKKFIGRRISQETKYLKRTMDAIRHTEEETLKPIWLKAREVARGGRKWRQITLVEDDPSIRLPKMLIPAGNRGHKREKLSNRSRQATLVEDNPKIRIPRMLLMSLPRIPTSRGTAKSRQLSITDSSSADAQKVPMLVKPRFQSVV